MAGVTYARFIGKPWRLGAVDLTGRKLCGAQDSGYQFIVLSGLLGRSKGGTKSVLFRLWMELSGIWQKFMFSRIDHFASF